jgi:hypothetical protein
LVFWNKIEKTDACWLWRGYINPNSGYGTFGYQMQPHYAHRFSYEHHVGAIPQGYEVDHSCRNPICVNPDHLEAVPPIVNKHRANPPKTHCVNGHPLNHENSYITPANKRQCRACRRERARRYLAEKRAA